MDHSDILCVWSHDWRQLRLYTRLSATYQTTVEKITKKRRNVWWIKLKRNLEFITVSEQPICNVHYGTTSCTKDK